MGRIKSFNLKRGTRIGSYRIVKNMGRGWEGEVYQVKEVPTEAVRALKLFPAGSFDSIRELVHYAWYYEQLRFTKSVPVYYHYGQWFLNDDDGCWYLIFEFVDGTPLSDLRPSVALFFRVAHAIARVHAEGYAVGDLALSNMLIRGSDRSVVIVDCEPGKPDSPNTCFERDCKTELRELASKMFRRIPATKTRKVTALLERLDSTKRFTRTTLRDALAIVAGAPTMP